MTGVGGVLTEESHCQVPHTCSPQCTLRPAFRHPNKQETKIKTRSHLVPARPEDVPRQAWCLSRLSSFSQDQ